MPIIKSAKKRLRQTKKRLVRNKLYEKSYKKALKQLKGTAKDKRDVLSKAYKAIDKAAKRGVIHKKKASRLKSKASRTVHIKTKSAK
ncbi:hypothetical protein A3G67_04660 [Candidatus Roizmanbacteria bacterium RIFCSPLOWO2_12_FULL_40_12]|uniref:Small ribosomal subunit protein bS20 n=1 Tax=Candidatus Roizmanbacteria bacterium RIFCSPLOWO2_01_FULL_40_42 TaxID=1802066 RepID=A0A1F7J4M3_9BACT|nr:MAG: hypothetical protein A2779_04490 [Candidatus Roizmanbacteria bacterium RIFCSPHIGHO2_01_FULL_40_98]OGK27333.1 MAG: hypothetical protein A3C31_04815 [Candidatus Roizmanbacteria bacterium RIFCSPHIGHO2_02_FULL_40_53]OGK30795.1 MAG: hypothetical protein A2W49_02225 [Candidatus Roizmanbacteria bacterium RIFCSPHIGHO2_12_41_18]OGK36438.1 MAG: hypothetical protein A3E69_02440 [Candidatus Roizmanbacteria bacterium RIFCSPHIGHO2_12_FULL_40_130]OGK50566.1 MAG: hypothetical protein A3B50_02170 [Candi